MSCNRCARCARSPAFCVRRPNIRFKTAFWYVCCIISWDCGTEDARFWTQVIFSPASCWFLSQLRIVMSHILCQYLISLSRIRSATACLVNYHIRKRAAIDQSRCTDIERESGDAKHEHMKTLQQSRAHVARPWIKFTCRGRSQPDWAAGNF